MYMLGTKLGVWRHYKYYCNHLAFLGRLCFGVINQELYQTIWLPNKIIMNSVKSLCDVLSIQSTEQLEHILIWYSVHIERGSKLDKQGR